MTYVPPDEPDLGNIAGYVKDLVESGFSSNQAYQAFVGDGGGIAESTFNRLYGFVSDSIARNDTWAALNPYQVPEPGDFGEVAMGGGGSFYATVEVIVRDRETGQLMTTWGGYHSADPFAPIEAASSVIADYGDPDAQSRYGVQVIGFGQVNMYNTVPWRG